MKWTDRVIPLVGVSIHDLLYHKVEEESQVEELETDPQIPEGYLDRFTLKPSEDPAMMLGREETADLLAKALKNWELEGHPLLLISEPGMGMTTFLNTSESMLPNVHRLEENHRILDLSALRHTLGDLLGVDLEDGPEALVEQLSEEPRTVIFENVERLFLRTPYGFERLQDLFNFIAHSRKKIFWILTINRFSTNFLDRVMEFSTNFRSRIMLGPLDKETLESSVFDRNKGYELVFLKPQVLPQRLARQYRKAGSQQAKQELLERHFMRAFHAYAAGNVSRGLLYFRKSVRAVREKRVYVKAYAHPIPRNIELPNLLALEAILQHSSLSISDLATVLRKPLHYALQRITFLQEAGLVVPQRTTQAEPEYQLDLNVLYEVKNEIHDKLNRKSY